jgi:hypothetical protein
MAKAFSKVPLGKWNDHDTKFWLRYKQYLLIDDSSGNCYIELQKELRESITQAREILDQHAIPISNIYSEEMLDRNFYDRKYCIAIGFATQADLVMAKLVLKCDEFS